MARIFITGSADGLGLLAAKELIKLGHQVMLHARNAERAKQALDKVPGAENVLIADLSSIDETKALASKANASGKFDAVIHNAGVYQVPKNSVSKDGLPLVFAVNSLAPYILTCLTEKPKRLIYLSSGMHRSGNPNLDNLPVGINGRHNYVTYSDTKLQDVILALVFAQPLVVSLTCTIVACQHVIRTPARSILLTATCICYSFYVLKNTWLSFAGCWLLLT